jgi:hypothetical protein
LLPAPLVIDLTSLSILAVVVRHCGGRGFGYFDRRRRSRGGCRSLTWTATIPIPILRTIIIR